MSNRTKEKRREMLFDLEYGESTADIVTGVSDWDVARYSRVKVWRADRTMASEIANC
jgi:hypothetical protein